MNTVKIALQALSVQEIEMLAQTLCELMEADEPPESDTPQERLSEALCEFRNLT